MANDTILPWEGDVARELGRRLFGVASYLHDHLERFSPPLQIMLNRSLCQPGKLFISNVAQGQPLSYTDKSLWSLTTVLAHAAAADLNGVDDPQEDWHSIIPLAAAAEVLGIACDLSDDIQDGDGELIHHYSLAVAEPLTVVLFALLRHILSDSSLSEEWRILLHDLITSAILDAAEAQFLDGWYEQQTSITFEEMRQIAERKGAPLVRAIFQMGAFAGFAAARPVNEAMMLSHEFGRFGELVGIWHQLTNDLRDSALDSPKSDRARGKKTLPLVVEQHIRQQLHDEQIAGVKGREAAMIAIAIAKQDAAQQLQRIAERCGCSIRWLRWIVV